MIDNRLKLFVLSSLIIGFLYFINEYMGEFYFKFFVWMLLAFFSTLAFIYFGGFLKAGFLVHMLFSAIILVIAGIALYFFLQFRMDFATAIKNTWLQ